MLVIYVSKNILTMQYQIVGSIKEKNQSVALSKRQTAQKVCNCGVLTQQVEAL